MELTCTASRKRRIFAPMSSALLYFVLWLCWLSMTDLLSLAPFVLPGAVLTFLLPGLPDKGRRWTALGLGAALLLWTALQWGRTGDSLAALANRVFAASESRQAYEYDYFPVEDLSPLWGLGVLWTVTALGAGLWKRRFLLPLGGISALAMAYFGVTPDPLWLSLLLPALGLTGLPEDGGWRFALPLLLAAALLTVALGGIKPSVTLSAAEERLRDALALESVTYESTPKPDDLPEPEPVPPPETRSNEPDTGTGVNILFLLLAALTLVILFVPAVIRDRAQRRRDRQREEFSSADAAAAVRAMYLHGKRWEAVDGGERVCPKEIYALWQEAAYSDHTLTEEQRTVMKAYLEGLEKEIWEKSDRITRFRIKYKLAL